jgi:hypothetical protein
MTLTCGICLPLLAESGKPGKRGVRETGKVPELLKIQMLARNKVLQANKFEPSCFSKIEGRLLCGMVLAAAMLTSKKEDRHSKFHSYHPKSYL